MLYHRRSKRGFTLLEILIVVAILALLAAFVVPSLWTRSEKAKKSMAAAAVGRNGPIAAGLNQYRLDVGMYPETDDGLEALFKCPSHIDEEDKIWDGPYLDGTPEELRDAWGKEYVYECPGKFNENGYDLSSKGKDGEEDTEDDIKNWLEK